MSNIYVVDEQNIASKNMDREAIAINLVTGDYFSFSGCAVVIWQVLAQGGDLPRLVAAVEAAFDEVPATAPAQISAFLGQLVAEKLVVPMPAETDLPALQASAERWGPYAEPGIDKFDDMAMMLALDPPMPELPTRVTDRLPTKKI
ncbi:MAG TPA: PqqD family protein [Aliidongia sp.]|uniref:PqqD family protein n=1 Tax=Aliidongia sp. TaxID=1914230 RepID=UPI002DDD20E4|nr:PqqD family protein [Aliidongia sp.]HEV2674598.1 PqqD family protein [Aliidongia sp.]